VRPVRFPHAVRANKMADFQTTHIAPLRGVWTPCVLVGGRTVMHIRGREFTMQGVRFMHGSNSLQYFLIADIDALQLMPLKGINIGETEIY
jgi:hypothetical protein